MNRSFIAAGFAALLALPLLAAPAAANASCADRKVTGTVLGGVGGALIGGALGHGTGALIGGLGGAVVGHEVAAGGCRRYRAYYRGSPYPQPPPPERAVYYDQYGAAVPIGPVAPGYPAAAAYDNGLCRTETRPYYDERGALVRTPVRVCAR
jgi:hypothetical protein